MDLKELDDFLKKENKVEIKQKITGQNVMDDTFSKEIRRIHAKKKDIKNFIMSKEFFFNRGDIFISKHNRYSKMPLHKHDFVEINYMYSGKCTQEIQGKKVILKEGDICFLDKNIYHAINSLGENDILINILIKSESINTSILQKMASDKSILAEFLICAAQQGNLHNQYIVFSEGENIKIQGIIKNIILEYFSENEYSMELIQLYLPILFIELIRSYTEKLYLYREKGIDIIVEALKIIEEKYKTITLIELAKELGFNKNYLGNLLKKETGQTFTNLVLKQRLTNAYNLVINTNYTMEEITERVGLSSTSYLHKIFKRKFKVSPGDLRNKKSVN